jgi:hypothetical protein
MAPQRRTRSRRVWWSAGAVLLPLGLAACGSGAGGGSTAAQSADAGLKVAGDKVTAQMSAYLSTAQACSKKPNPVVCLEAADRTLGNQVHDFANLLATGHGFTAPPADLAAARNTAQTLANSLEILGDAQPTQANYDQVRNTFNVTSAIHQLHDAVAKVQRESG